MSVLKFCVYKSLKWAAENGCLKTIKYLVKLGVDIHIKNDMAMRYSARNGHIKVLKYLVNLGADIHVENDEALRYSAYKGYIEVVKYLVSQDANIHAENEWALRYSVSTGNVEVVKYLITLGANINIAIEYSPYLKHILKNNIFIKKDLYEGQLNEQTETECCICLSDMKNNVVIQCKTCKKCVHALCMQIWGGNCVYCRH